MGVVVIGVSAGMGDTDKTSQKWNLKALIGFCQMYDHKI